MAGLDFSYELGADQVVTASTSPGQKGGSDRKGKTKATATNTSASRDASPRKRKTVNYSDFAPLEAPGPSRPRSPPAATSTTNSTDNDLFEGMEEDEIFQLVTKPDEIEGVADWGIPSEVNPDEADDKLKVSIRDQTRSGGRLTAAKAKVEHFLRLKYERGQHINSTLLTSSSFANPHIYAKLVRLSLARVSWAS